MTRRDYFDEELMAFADGELDEATAAEIEDAINHDEALATRVVMFMDSREAARSAFGPLADEPVPPALSASLARMIDEAKVRRDDGASGDPATVVAPVPRRAANDNAFTRFAIPLAASLAAVVAGTIGYMAGAGAPGGGDPDRLAVAGLDRPALSQALDTVRSGTEIELDGGGDRFRVIATFRDAAGDLCREFEVDTADSTTVVSVACRPADAWRVNFAVVAPAANGGYAPASSTESLDAYLGTIGAGEPLDGSQEGEALDALR